MTHYRGRFAPSPTGPLHIGSLASAMSSYLEARQHQGSWLLRIDDIDQTRTIPGMDKHIIHALERLGFEWENAACYQSKQQPAYQTALDHLQAKSLLYACRCSRKAWQATASVGVDGPVYPGICRNAAWPYTEDVALRIRTDHQTIHVQDPLHGSIQQSLQTEVGDFIVRRKDGYIAYQLAVVVDDHLAGITHVVRGADLLLSTPRQVYLQQQLGYVTPAYQHTPIILDNQGKKLSKSDAACPVNLERPLTTLNTAWHLLQNTQIPDMDQVADFWNWATMYWDVNQLRNIKTIGNSGN